MIAMKIFLVRHGQTEGNVKDLLQGGGSDAALTANGREEAVQAGQKLSFVPFDMVYASPKLRTQKTAQYIMQASQYTLPKMQIEEALNEMNFGTYESEPIKTFIDKQHFDLFLDSKKAHQVGGESFQDVTNRVTTFINQLDSSFDNVLCVSHGMTLMCLLKSLVPKQVPKQMLSNASIIVLDNHSGEWKLRLY